MKDIEQLQGDPQAALDYLARVDPDLRAAAIFGAEGELLAFVGRVDGGLVREAPGTGLEDMLSELFALASRGHPVQPTPADTIEVAFETEEVFCCREGRLAALAVTGRLVLQSLMLYDLRAVLRRLQRNEETWPDET